MPKNRRHKRVDKQHPIFHFQFSILHSRPGTTLVELLIFLVVLSIVIAMALPMLFAATESRLLQQTIAVVEQNGTQVLQNATLHIRQAERILSPAIGQTGSVLALQTASGTLHPTIIGVSSGNIVLIEGTEIELISSPQVAIQNFVVRNTSTSATRQSVSITFRASRTIRLQAPHSYARMFSALVTLLPDDITEGNPCGCTVPACEGNDIYGWQVCRNGFCVNASTTLDCD